jgi:signal transduction histidine kinase
MTNAFQHSGATEIVVTLNYETTCFTLMCKDNGCGFDEGRGAEAYRRGHYGLRGMVERSERIGGKFVYASTSTHGTEIMTRVPSGRAYKRDRLTSRLFSLVGIGRVNA